MARQRASYPCGVPSPPDSQPALDVRDLVKRYGATTAVAGLSLAVDRGSVLALLGPNGAGKTTTVEVCEGFRHADGGSVRVLGLDPVRDAAALKPRIGVMLQSGGAYPAARAGEMLRLVASYAAQPLPVDDLLDMLGLQDAVNTPYRRLSGGQQQRLSLAMAIVGRPELVFLDEPTAGLDPQARHATWKVVEQLRADGVAVVLTTHYMEEAERLADRVVVIDHGKQVAQGSPAELTHAGAAGQLRFSAPPGLPLDSLRAALPEGCRVTEGERGSYLVEGAVDPHLLSAVTSWCAERDVLAADLRVERRTLEDVFLELTGRELR
ncbi:MAG: ABC transporter ATP-binding protein [Actinobacteria bacterium]|nr:ABC transporter ATP-binding protein [Actinomycetota bacterium]